MDILQLEHIKKQFGQFQVIKDVSFTVGQNTVFGLIGKNGAGKTTLMKMILGFLGPDNGTIQVCGRGVTYGGAATNRYIGYLPDVPEFYSYMTPKEYLKMCGQLAGLKSAETNARVDELLTLVGLEDSGRRRIHGFSRGMKQRLGVAQALLGKPRLLICDEPTSALDPVGRKELLDILSVAKKQTSILFSTHILSDVERICDRIGILHGGKIALTGRIDEIKNSYRQDSVRVELMGQAGAQALADDCAALPFVSAAEVCENVVTIHLANASDQSSRILELLSGHRAPVLKYEVLEPSLEDVFLGVVE